MVSSDQYALYSHFHNFVLNILLPTTRYLCRYHNPFEHFRVEKKHDSVLVVCL